MGTINNDPPRKRRRVGLIYDDRMCKHNTPDETHHPENPNRIRAVWDKLNRSGVAQRCVVLNAKKVEDNQLALVHSKKHIDLINTISSTNFMPRIEKIAAKYDSIYFNEGSSEAANLAAGSVIEAAQKVAKGELDSAFAIVRPPGHHAEEDEPMGFCLYNNVAIAASYLLNERPELGIKKILIVDWDVHHGNSTQKIFYKDPRVLFFSVHRHENGSFYPYGNDGSYVMTGEGPGAGYNINVPWESGWCGDSDYIAVWDHILIPVAKEFDPDMIIISAGFDAAIGDPLGGCCVSQDGYSIMLDKLMDFARGKIVMALEGGYNPISLATSAQACVEVLLQDKPLIRSLEDSPLKSTWRIIQAVRQALCVFWPVLAAKLPDKMINGTTSQIEVDVAIHDEENAHITNLLANTEAGKDHSADKNFHLKVKRNSLDEVRAHFELKSRRFSLFEAESVGGDRTRPEPRASPPTNRDTRPAASGSNTPPIAASWTPSKRACLDVPAGRNSRSGKAHIPFSCSVDNYDWSALNDEDFTWDEESVVQRLVNNENVDMLEDMSIDDLVHDINISVASTLNSVRVLGKRGINYEGRVTELKERLKGSEEELKTCKDELKASEDEVARLRKENMKLAAACVKAEKALDHEITTGDKFLESEAGKERLKNVVVDEFKKSEAFHNEVLHATAHIYTEVIDLYRERHQSSRRSSGD